MMDPEDAPDAPTEDGYLKVTFVDKTQLTEIFYFKNLVAIGFAPGGIQLVHKGSLPDPSGFEIFFPWHQIASTWMKYNSQGYLDKLDSWAEQTHSLHELEAHPKCPMCKEKMNADASQINFFGFGSN